MIRRTLFLLAFVCSTANAQFTPGQILTASQLNAALAAKTSNSAAAITGGSITNATINGGTMSGTAITGGTISGLTSPLPVASGGTGATASTGSGNVVLATAPTIAGLTVTGTFTAPGLISPGSLASQAANTVLANVTASSHTPTAVAMPSCSTSTSALQYTSGTGFTCYANSASLTGATFTGWVNVSPGSGDGALVANSVAGNTADVYLQTGGSTRWGLIRNNATESGSNAGSNFQITRYTDAGTSIDNPLTITRSTGVVTMADGITNSPISGSTGSFTTLSTSGTATLNSLATGGATIGGGTINGTTVGATTPSTGSFTTLASSGTVSGTGFSNYLASPPAIGGTAAAAGSFTALSAAGTVSGTGFSSYLASPPAIGTTTAAAGKFTTLQATSAITPAYPAGIVGNATGSAVTAGSVGEYLSATASAVSATSSTLGNVASLPLTAGDWDLGCTLQTNPAAGTTTSGLNYGLTTTSGGQAAFPNVILQSVSFPAAVGYDGTCPAMRLNVSGATTVYLTAATTFASGTLTHSGFIWARRR